MLSLLHLFVHWMSSRPDCKSMVCQRLPVRAIEVGIPVVLYTLINMVLVCIFGIKCTIIVYTGLGSSKIVNG